MKFKFGLLPRVVLAIALGVACGFFLPGWATRIALTFNAIFGQFLGFAIPLLILGLVAPGIADLGRNAGRLLALTAALAECGGHALLFDCGEGTQVGLRRYGVSAYRLSAVLLTHYHGDHILGLPGLLQTLGSLNRTEPLTIYGPKGIEPVAQAVTALAGPQAYPVRWQVADEPFHIDTLKITPFPLTHRVPCCGYLLALPRAGRFDPARARAAGIPMPYWKTLQRGEAVGGCTPEQVLGAPRRGLKVVYATDTRPCAALEAAARDADLLCMDATYADDADLPKAKLYGHATCRETGALAAAANVRRLWLTHYSAAVTDPAPGLAAARTAYPAAVAGYDGLTEELELDREP